MSGFAMSQALRLGSNLILTRLLFPEAFGQMALVSVFIQGLQMFSDMGTGAAIVQNPRGDDRRFLDTAWTIQVVRGLLLWAGAWALSRPIAEFYGEPLLAWLLPAAGMTSVFAGLESTSLFTAQRHLELKRLTIVELTAQFLNVAVMISWALIGRSLHGPDNPSAVWALVAGSLAGSAARFVLSHTVFPGRRDAIRVEREALRALLAFGRWVFVSTLLGFLAGQTDRLVFAKMIPIGMLGVYGVAAALAALPTQAALKLAGTVVLPAYSRLAAVGDLGDAFSRVRWPLLLVAGPAIAGLIGCGPFLIGILYDDRYAAAGWILPFLAAAAWFQVLESANGAALIARGRVSWVAAGSAAKLAGMVILLPLGFHLGGFRGALTGLVLSDACRYLASAVGVAPHSRRALAVDGPTTALVIAVSIACRFVGTAAAKIWGHDLAGLLAGAAFVGLTWAFVALFYLRREGATPQARPRESST